MNAARRIAWLQNTSNDRTLNGERGCRLPARPAKPTATVGLLPVLTNRSLVLQDRRTLPSRAGSSWVSQLIASSPDITDCLAQSAMFESLSGEDRAAVTQLMRPVHFPAKQTIFADGDDADGLYVLRSGGVGITFTTSDGRDVSLSYATVGAVFGEIAALDGGRRSADATALTDVECLFLPHDALSKALAARPAFARAVIRFLCARVRDADLKLEAMVVQSVEARLARFLLSAVEARTRGASKGHVPVTLGISQSELGLLVGASRANVGAALALLEHEGAVRLNGSDIVCEAAILNRIAGQGWD